MKLNFLKFALVATATLFAVSGTALAFGDNTPTKPVNKPSTLLCKKHFVIKTALRKGKTVKYCARLVAGLLSDEDLYQQGRDLAKAGYYDDALEVLASITDQNDPKVLNYIGYSHRKAGRLETGVSYYNRALAIDPNYILAREYLGEGYVAAGRVDLAMVQLGEIKTRCGDHCAEYKLLQQAITSAQS